MSTLYSATVKGRQRMHELTIRKSVLRIFKVLKCFGFAAFTVENGKSVTKLMDLVFFALNLLVSFSLLSISCIYRDDVLKVDSDVESEVINFGNFVTFIATNALSSVTMILGFVFRHRTWKILVMASKIDRMLNNIGFCEDYSASANNISKFFLFIIILAIPLNCFVFLTTGSALKAGLYMYSSFYFILSSASIFIFMSGTCLRIRTINKVCESILNCTSSVRMVTSGQIQNNDNELISVVIKIYDKLVKVQEIINLTCGGPALMGLGVLYFYSIFTCFMVYKDFDNDGRLEYVTIASILFALYLHIFAFSVIYICSLKITEARTTLDLSNRILRRSKNKTEIALLMTLNALIDRNPPKLSCGFFEVDWKFVYGVSYTSSSHSNPWFNLY